MRVDVYIHWTSADINQQLDTIQKTLNRIEKKEISMSAELDALTAKVTDVDTVMGSAVVLIGGLAAQIAALKNDPAALQALADSLEAAKKPLADAIAANTPAAPPAA